MSIFDSLMDNIHEALMNDKRTAGAQIDVVTQQGIVTLTGVVPSNKIAEAAEEIASHQEGVIKVVNSLKIQTKEVNNV
jgi:hyperosmotically inducible protein